MLKMFKLVLSFILINAVSATCPSGWQLFNRTKSEWCIKVFNGTLVRKTAEEYCRREGATLTGIETAAERAYIINQARPIVIAAGAGSIGGSIWIGLKRKSECLGKYRNDTQCLPSGTNAMEWTDNHTIGIAGFFWRSNEPDYYLELQPYVIMHVFSGLGISPVMTGMMSDCSAEMLKPTDVPLNTIYGFACGQLAN